jgi:hypothetical protein
MVTHDTPATLDPGPNSLKVSIGFLERSAGGLAEVRPSNENRQMRGQEKCRR